jgi:hypothetical protein
LFDLAARSWDLLALMREACGGTSVAVVETTDLGLGPDPPLARCLYLARPRCIVIKGLVGRESW